MKYAVTLYLHNNIFKTFYLEPFPPVKHFVSSTGQAFSLKREMIMEKILLCYQHSDNQ